ncbi:MAG: FKBP-type peptidyl-prolyl cis-trans isomerase [Desulfobaccales bacterium]
MMIRKLMAVLAVMLLAAQASAAEIKELKTDKDKVSYGIGVAMAKNLKGQGIEVNSSALLKGLQDELKGGKLLMTEADLQATMGKFKQEMMAKQVAAMKKAGETNQKEGDAFLAENKKKKDIVTLPSGLQYKIITEGKGKKPAETDTVEVNYRGTLINDTEFDSSYKRGQAATLKVKEIIPGWREALQLMPMGSKWQIFIPAKLAYGEKGAGPIGPNATLIFEVELLAIK